MSFLTVPAKAAVLFVSSFFRSLAPRACRFYPSCSQYSIEAYDRFGFSKGSALTAGRLLKCHPFHPGGHDPL